MRFRRYLKHIEQGLDVPYPERESLLREIGSHLEDLYGEKRRDGADRASAEAHAVRVMALDEDFIASIDTVHAPRLRRALASLPPPLSTLIENTGIGLLAVIVITVLTVKEKAMLEFFGNGGIVMMLLNLMGIAILILVGERIFSLFLKKDHSAANLGRRMLSLKFLGLASCLLGVLGTLIGYFHAFAVMADSKEKQLDPALLWDGSRIAISTTIWGLFLALITLVAWYVFAAKAARIEQMRVQ